MKVVFNHDAAIDEYIAGILLYTMPSISVENIIITHGDCVAGPAMNAAYRIQRFINESTDVLSLSTTRSWNQFPWEYRKDSITLNTIDCLKGEPINAQWPFYPTEGMPSIPYDQLAKNERTKHLINLTKPDYPQGETALINTLTQALNANEKITLLICCPLTLLCNVLQQQPSLAKAIDHVIWMGGAVKGLQGNLDPETLPADIANPYAEWNVFWDPYAVAWVFENTEFPITLFPLNVTDHAKITPELLAALKSQGEKSPVSKLVWECYQLTLTQPFYCMWDVTAACYLERPDLFSDPVEMNLAIISDGYYQGTLIEEVNGRPVNVIMAFADLDGFYTYVLNQLNR